MAIDLTKVPLLSHVQYLYGDIRDRIKEKYSKPEEGIPASDLAPGVIPDIGLIENEKAPIIMETASGNPIVITDGAAGLPLSECELTLLPKQDLHGQTAPYPPGGGKNKLNWTNESQTINGVTFTVNSDGTVLVNGTATDADASFYSAPGSAGYFSMKAGSYIISGCPSGGSNSTYLINEVVNSKADYGSGAAFTIENDTDIRLRILIRNGYTANNLLFKPMIRLASVSDDTFAPYSNICPITPWENVGTWHGGKNLLDLSSLRGGTFDAPSSAFPTPNITTNDYIPIKGGQTYVWSQSVYTDGSNQGRYVRWYNSEKEQIGSQNIYSEAERTIEAPQDAVYARFMWYQASYFNSLNDVITRNPQIESGSSATTYASYIPVTTHSADLTGITPPVYGGTLDMTTGVLMVEYKKYSIISFSGIWNNTVNPNGTPVYVVINGTTHQMASIDANMMKSNIFTYTSLGRTNAPLYGYGGNDGGNTTHTFILPGTITTLAEANEWLANNPIECMFRLEEPITYQLTPAEVSTFLGTNTIWSDANSIDIEYRADTGLFINQNSVKDVKVNGTSVTTDGVANMPIASDTTVGVVKVDPGFGTAMRSSPNQSTIMIRRCPDSSIKPGTDQYRPLVPYSQHISTFYGLAKAAGADMAQSSNPVGTYTDLAIQAIQKMLGLAGLLGPYEDDITADRAYAIGETFVMDGKRYKATAAIAQGGIITPGTNCELCPLSLSDIQINGQSIIQNGIANIPPASSDNLGVVREASGSDIKAGRATKYLTTKNQFRSVFYGLAEAAGANLADVQNVTIGTYPQNAKDAIQSMLGIEADIPLVETVSGTTPSITGMPNVRYICGEVSLLTITPPASGSIVVRFSSGSTATVLTAPNTVKWPSWFDPTDLEANTTYELIITDGVYGGAMTWAD